MIHCAPVTRKPVCADPEVIYCDECWQEITEEPFYVIGFGKGHASSDTIICPRCMQENHARYINDFIQERKQNNDL